MGRIRKQFNLGDEVRWTNYQGRVVEIVPRWVFPVTHPIVRTGQARDRESYVVRSGQLFFWPSVHGLKALHSDAQLPQEALKPKHATLFDAYPVELAVDIAEAYKALENHIEFCQSLPQELQLLEERNMLMGDYLTLLRKRDQVLQAAEDELNPP